MVISFKRNGYDPFVDFLKGVCIIWVLLNHCVPAHLQQVMLFPLWGGQAVPIFILIQVFHSYKNGVTLSHIEFRKIWRRIIKPFLFVEIAIILTHVLELCIRDGQGEILPFLNTIYFGGGRGPGSYYPWIYFQFAVILPTVSFLFRKYNKRQLLIIFLTVSQLMEFSWSIINIPDWPYYSLSFLSTRS